jgi:hypothetical protein
MVLNKLSTNTTTCGVFLSTTQYFVKNLSIIVVDRKKVSKNYPQALFLEFLAKQMNR